MSHIAVIDIGKTNAKLALVDAVTLTEIAVETLPNRVLPGPPWPHYDIEGIWVFLLGALARFQASYAITAISVTTHGASIVLLDEDGNLAAPMLDYEHDGPDALAAAYDALRPPFAETGSPRLPLGLNAGAQLHWMFAVTPGLADRVATILTYPQYWGFRLTGVAVTEVTSLGCHTDLWEPAARRFSTLVARLGLAHKIAPALRSADVLGPVLPEIAAATGLDPATEVRCGIHDSNASLLPHVIGRAPPFSVVSTGTWVVCMAVGGAQVTLDPTRDTLINVNALGDPVPSARFMGGRAFDLLMAGSACRCTEGAPAEAAIAAVLQERVMLLPSVVSEAGPFQRRTARWTPAEPAIGSGERTAAACFYLALMTAECLALIGHRGPAVVEGPFARNRLFCEMLAVATGGPVETADGATGTSQGAALLATVAPPPSHTTPLVPTRPPAALAAYAQAWRAALTG